MVIKIKNRLKLEEFRLNCIFKPHISKEFGKSQQSFEKPSIEL